MGARPAKLATCLRSSIPISGIKVSMAAAVTVPILTSESGLPMGAQLVGARGNDARLLRTAQWLYDWVDR